MGTLRSFPTHPVTLRPETLWGEAENLCEEQSRGRKREEMIPKGLCLEQWENETLLTPELGLTLPWEGEIQRYWGVLATESSLKLEKAVSELMAPKASQKVWGLWKGNLRCCPMAGMGMALLEAAFVGSGLGYGLGNEKLELFGFVANPAGLVLVSFWLKIWQCHPPVRVSGTRASWGSKAGLALSPPVPTVPTDPWPRRSLPSLQWVFWG